MFEEPDWPPIKLDLRKSSLVALAISYGDLTRLQSVLDNFSFSADDETPHDNELDKDVAITLATFGHIPLASAEDDNISDTSGDSDTLEEMTRANMRLRASRQESLRENLDLIQRIEEKDARIKELEDKLRNLQG
jgi:hypothetical protein